MRARHRRSGLVACVVVLAVVGAACTGVLGVTDITAADAGPDATQSEGSSSGEGSADGPGTDGATKDGGDATVGSDAGSDATPGGEGGAESGSACDAGAICNPGSTGDAGPCVVYATSCAGGVSSCQATPNDLPNGSACGSGQVCENGACGPCPDAGACVPSNVCNLGALNCASGTCTDTGNPAPDGTVCGTDMVCKGGTCAPCVAGLQCTPTNPCDTGLTLCTTGASVCVDTGPGPAGQSCGANMVCNNGVCITCDAGVSCTPTNPCDQGMTSCGTGASQCVDTDAQAPNGTSCGTDTVCNAGVCTSCTPSLPCTPANPCDVGSTSCLTGTQTCTDTNAHVNDGTSCGTNMFCVGGVCSACTPNAFCQPTGKPCNAGSVSCTTGAPVCNDTGNPAPNGTVCGTGMVCSAGTCTACVQGGACVPTNPCDTGTLNCSTLACTDTGTHVGDGTSCGSGMQCKSGKCCGVYEICNNGVDDNCDGLVDCADPQCTADGGTGGNGQWQCAALPTQTGWTLVGYDGSGRPPCPANFGATATDFIVGVSGAAPSCSCACNPVTPASCEGRWNWTTNGSSNTCPAKPTSGGLVLHQGVCLENPGDNLAQTWAFIGASNSVSTVPGVCGETTTTTKPNVQETNVEACTLTQAGGGCGAPSECVPVVAGFTMCSLWTGTGTFPGCPVGTITTTVYTGYSDKRGCNDCQCGTDPIVCSLTGAQYYTGSGCTGTTCEITGTCAKCPLQASGDTNSMLGVFTHTGNAGACQVTQNATATSGTVTATGATMMCCLP